MATGKGCLQPKSPMDPQVGRIKKVFIAYVHNPDEYEVYVPPCRPEQLLDPNILRIAIQHKMEHEQIQRDNIRRHTETVKRLAVFLTERGVPVVYDDYFNGSHVSNRLQQYEQQIVDSDYVLLVITPSMNYYLTNVAPIDEEILFTEDFLFNLMTVKKPQGTHFIPVFINCQHDTGLVPTFLASAKSYAITEPFDCHSGDLRDMYCLFTNRSVPSLPTCGSVVQVSSKRSAFSVGFSSPHNSSQLHAGMYNTLSNRHELLSESQLQYISGPLSTHWQAIARSLGLTERDIADCQIKAGAFGSSCSREACYQMLRSWQCNNPSGATVARLATGVWSANCGWLLKQLL